MAEHSARPPTTGTSDMLTINEVRSPSIIRAKMTVKKGADDCTVSVNDTATNLRLTRPSMTVAKRMIPTIAISKRKFRSGCDESGVACGRPPIKEGQYILIAPKVAVETIWLIASKSGSQPSVVMMCLLPKRVAPLIIYQHVMKNTMRP